jgi:arsenate reductase (thioredoxin)
MAQGFLQSFDKDLIVCSAGTDPSGEISREAVEVMKEVGIDIRHNKPKSVDLYLNDSWDYVITVCDNAKESCPVFPGEVKHRLHIGFEDPSKATGTDEYIRSEFRRIRDQIRIEFLDFYERNLRMI